jgi:hypothetical protein
MAGQHGLFILYFLLLLYCLDLFLDLYANFFRVLYSKRSFFFKGVLMIIDYCLAGTPKDDLYNIPDDSRDTEDLVSENY